MGLKIAPFLTPKIGRYEGEELPKWIQNMHQFYRPAKIQMDLKIAKIVRYKREKFPKLSQKCINFTTQRKSQWVKKIAPFWNPELAEMKAKNSQSWIPKTYQFLDPTKIQRISKISPFLTPKIGRYKGETLPKWIPTNASISVPNDSPNGASWSEKFGHIKVHFLPRFRGISSRFFYWSS